MIIQILLITSVFLSINTWIIYGIHLQYQEKIEQTMKDIDKEYDEILDMLDTDWAYQNEIQDKRLYKKHLLKLKQELTQKNNLISYMQHQAKESRLYKKYFINNTK